MPRYARNLLKTVFILSCLGALVYWVLATIYLGFAMAHAPLTPDPAHGVVVPFDNHGTVHYFTAAKLAERFWIRAFGFVTHGSLIGSAILGLVFNKPKASAE